MQPIQNRRKLFILVGACALMIPATSRAQLGMDKDPFGKVGQDPPSQNYGESGATYKPVAPEPYGGQIFCPVSGTKLGLHQPPVPVQTAIGEEKPTGLAKLFHQKSRPGAVIYACCPECAEKIRSNPQLYFSQLAVDKATFVFRYASAPPQRPTIAPVAATDERFGSLQAVSATGAAPAAEPSAPHPEALPR